MQVSACLIAAQQAAREAQAQFQARIQTAAPKPLAGDSFAAALGDFSQKPNPAAAAAAPVTGQSMPAARMGSLLDITI